MNISLQPWSLTRWLLAAVVFLIGTHVVLTFGFNYGLGHGSVLGLVRAFDVDREFNIPAFFSGMLLLYCALLLHLVAHLSGRADPLYRQWRLLGWLFAFLTADELLSIHERLNEPMQALFNTSGFFAFAWIIPYALAVIVLAVMLIPFLRGLPSRTMWRFVLAGAIFVGGAVGMEMLAAKELDSIGEKTWLFALYATIEETMEMTGLLLFSHALLQYITVRVPNFSVQLVGARATSADETRVPENAGGVQA